MSTPSPSTFNWPSVTNDLGRPYPDRASHFAINPHQRVRHESLYVDRPSSDLGRMGTIVSTTRPAKESCAVERRSKACSTIMSGRIRDFIDKLVNEGTR